MIKSLQGLKNWPLKKSQNSKNENALTPQLEGFRVDLRFPDLADYVPWADVRRRNQAFLTPYEPQWSSDALSQDFFIRRLKRQQQEWQAGRGAFFLIHHKISKDIIGGINLNDIRMGAARHASLGYWLDEDSQGQGYMTEAGLLVMNYAFGILNLRRLNAACLVDNQPSIKLLTTLGFEEEGFAKQYLQINGNWQDHRLFGLASSASL